MEKKFRVLTVNGKQYAWWHTHRDGNVTIMLSPLNDKNTVIKVEFNIIDYSVGKLFMEFPAYIIMNKNNQVERVKTLDPKMAGLLLEYLSEQDKFIVRNIVTIDGYELLSEMGYHICEIQNGMDW